MIALEILDELEAEWNDRTAPPMPPERRAKLVALSGAVAR